VSLEALVVKNAIMSAFEDEVVAGGDFYGWRVYDAEDKHKRVFYPHIVVYTPVSTLVSRFVGGGRTFQITVNVELFFTERDGVVVSGVTYKRDNATLIYAERAEAILENITYPDTIIEDGVPTTRSVGYVLDLGNTQIYSATVGYMVDYVVS
jgi:hypothetical protein